MCLILLAWQPDSATPLLVAANRDEYHQRAAQPARFWPEQPQLLAGRDLQAGGTWLGVTRSGRFAAVTNFREPGITSGERSRGELCIDFLLGTSSGAEFTAALADCSASYGGFNLILWDGARLCYYSNQNQRSLELQPGIYGISNGYLDDPWPKVVAGKQALAQIRQDGDVLSGCMEILADRGQPEDAHLPDTGVGIDFERFLAPRFILSEDYGTRVSTALALYPGRRASLREQSFGSDGGNCGLVEFDFQLV